MRQDITPELAMLASVPLGMPCAILCISYKKYGSQFPVWEIEVVSPLLARILCG